MKLLWCFSQTVPSQKFGISLGLNKERCYKNYKELCQSENKRIDGIDVVSIMTPPSSHQDSRTFIKNTCTDKPFAGSLSQAKNYIKQSQIIKILYTG